ncbi:MAG: SDR family oxidoreductase [gamma proteobacterium symbiont of Bathyaustriella thionipta]|nr:SDR family oxidoreductase [gamma proteobacterium symbiont of Bathyaustriella thionipta]MCU7950825.1 SDR family oxidoreductase [gamma proteobacterium symbiont of Bathyaustriella thionipta]MCU7952048.1 SDR family oxidoreductase [gamma proteobacterium symbiont of Bathyaustriella thionipta]MCU7957337.1 SDR family oxidoreductase [gamma proteobacterium symbiont of Bathyaustriella thionipta]MCU7967399.1 SDR family oxidoreductase [gamma proteobacterium symbiont of Bathyaustriella thionipta]
MLSMKGNHMQNKKEKPVSIIGCGYMGRRLLQQLLSRKLTKTEHIDTLVKSDKSQEQCLQAGVTSIQFDMDDSNSHLPETFQISDSILYYFAPPPNQGTIDSRARQFIKQLKNNTPCRIILISTTGVYGNSHGQWVTEETPLNPEVDRARRRVDAEQQFQSYCQKFHIPLVILRVSGIYGPGKLPLKRIKAKTPIVREEDSPFSNRIHADDLLEICLQAGLSDAIEGIFNCADGHPTTMCDYFMKVAKANKLPQPPTITLEQAKTQLSAGMLSYMTESRRIDNQKLLSIFKRSLKYPDLDKGLAHSN